MLSLRFGLTRQTPEAGILTGELSRAFHSGHPKQASETILVIVISKKPKAKLSRDVAEPN